MRAVVFALVLLAPTAGAVLVGYPLVDVWVGCFSPCPASVDVSVSACALEPGELVVAWAALAPGAPDPAGTARAALQAGDGRPCRYVGAFEARLTDAALGVNACAVAAAVVVAGGVEEDRDRGCTLA